MADIMDKAAFKTLSYKWTSKRDGTIAEIDTQLDAYHHGLAHGWPPNEDELDAVTRLRAVVDKFQREKEEKYLNRDWHIRKTQSEKRRAAVQALRDQVYARMWELYHPKRQDIELYDSVSSDDEGPTRVEELTAALDKLRIGVKATGSKANKLRSKLHADVEAWLKKEGKAIWLGLKGKDNNDLRKAWFYYYKDSNDPQKINPQDIIRLATVDLADLIDDSKCTYLKYADSSSWDQTEKHALGKMAMQGDALIGTRTCKHPPVEKFPEELRDELAAYLEELLGNEMAAEVLFIRGALRGEPYYRAVAHLDYYAFRSLTNIGLHKDTVGNSVFVALHYMNGGKMMGPEYIDDPAPVRPKGGNGFYADKVYLRNAGDVERHGAPWAKVRDVKGKTKYVWPEDLLQALQAARKPPDQTDYIQGYQELPKNGLVTFVDELVFHATPYMFVRDALESTDTPQQRTDKRRHFSSGVTIAGAGGIGGDPVKLNVYGERTFRTRIVRRLSTARQDGEDLPPATSGDDEIRRFWRVWLTVVPKHWYEELEMD